MRFLTLALILLSLTGCSSSKQKLHLFIWSDFISPEVIQSFEEANDCIVVIDTFDTNEAMYAKIKTGSPGYDLIFPTDYIINLMVHEGLLHKLDPARIPNFQNIDVDLLRTLNYEVSPYAIPYLVTFSGIAWNTKRAPLDEVSWHVFANSKFKGRMTMLNDVREVIGAALLTLGYSVNTVNIDELNEAKELIITWKRNLAKFESEQYKIGLATNEYFITQSYNTDIGQLQEEVDYIDFAIPKEGGIVSFDTVAIPEGARNGELAYRFISYLLDPQVAALNVEQTKGLTPVIGVLNHVDPAQKSNEVIFPSKESMARCQAIQDIGVDIKLYNRLWDQIKLRN